MRITNQRGVRKTRKSHNPKNKKVLLKWLVLLVLLVIALNFYKDSLKDIIEGVKALSVVQIGVSLLFSFCFSLTEGFIVYYMVHPFEKSYQWKKGIRTAYLSEFYRLITLGNGSGLATIYYLQKDGVSYPKGTGITMLQYVMKKIGVMLLGLTGFFFLLGQESTSEVLHGYTGAMTAGCFITLAVVFIMTAITLSKTVRNWIVFALDKLELKFPKYAMNFKQWRENLNLLNDTGRELLTHKKRFLVVVLLNLWKLFVIYLIPAYVLSGQCSLSIIESTMLMAVSYMLAGVIPAPSGIGSLEFVFLLFFTRFADEAAAVPAILVFRLVTWIVPFGIGGIILLFNKLKVNIIRKSC